MASRTFGATTERGVWSNRTWDQTVLHTAVPPTVMEGDEANLRHGSSSPRQSLERTFLRYNLDAASETSSVSLDLETKANAAWGAQLDWRIREMLVSLGLMAAYAQRFVEEAITLEDLLEIDEEEIKVSVCSLRT